MTTFGIDLGTTYSCIAYVDEAGRATVVKNALGEELTPSVVYFESADSVVVGREAKAVAKLFPKLVVSQCRDLAGSSRAGAGVADCGSRPRHHRPPRQPRRR